MLVEKSVKSFSQQIKKVAVELFTEKREVDHMELIMNNALALALNSKSSECVQVSVVWGCRRGWGWGLHGHGTGWQMLGCNYIVHGPALSARATYHGRCDC